MDRAGSGPAGRPGAASPSPSPSLLFGLPSLPGEAQAFSLSFPSIASGRLGHRCPVYTTSPAVACATPGLGGVILRGNREPRGLEKHHSPNRLQTGRWGARAPSPCPPVTHEPRMDNVTDFRDASQIHLLNTNVSLTARPCPPSQVDAAGPRICAAPGSTQAASSRSAQPDPRRSRAAKSPVSLPRPGRQKGLLSSPSFRHAWGLQGCWTLG